MAGLIAVAAPIGVMATPSVALDSAVFVERVVPNKGRLLQPAGTLKRGDRVVYVVSWYRMGGKGAFTVTNPLSRRVYFQGSSDGREEVSIDGGRTWGKLDRMKISGRNATPEDVTHVRWRISADQAQKGSGEITYSAIVR